MRHMKSFYCEAPGCVAFFFPLNTQAPLFRGEALGAGVGDKEIEDPLLVCYCFGFTRQDIWDEIRSTGKSTVAKRITAEVEAGRCACEMKNPSGKCCLGDVTRIVKGRLNEKGGAKL